MKQGLAWKNACMNRTRSVLAKKNIKLASVSVRDRGTYSSHSSASLSEETQKSAVLEIEEMYIDIIETIHVLVYPNGISSLTILL